MWHFKNKASSKSSRFDSKIYKNSASSADFKRFSKRGFRWFAGFISHKFLFVTISIGLCLFGVALYFVFFSQVFLVDRVQVIGVEARFAEILQKQTLVFLQDSNKFHIPNSHLWFLSSKKLTTYLYEQYPSIYGLEIRRVWPNTLWLKLNNRRLAYEVETEKDKTYKYFEDGTLLETSLGYESSHLPPLKLVWQGELDESGKPIWPNNFWLGLNATVKWVTQYSANSNFSFTSGLPVGSLKITGESDSLASVEELGSEDLVVHIKNPANEKEYKIYFNLATNLNEVFARTEAVLSQLSKPKKTSLFYLDMRYENRAFLCYENTPCSLPRARKVDLDLTEAASFKPDLVSPITEPPRGN